MNPRFRLPMILAPVLAVFLLAGCTTHLQRKEQYLRQAGFRTVTPSTPVQIAKVRSLPQGRIQHITRHGRELFVLADAKKNFLLVGGNPQLEAYQQILYTQQVDPAIENRAFDKALEYDGAGWGGIMDPFFGPLMMY